MMTTTALMEHLGAALHACGEGDVEQALSYVLAIYEEGHFRDELAAVLGQRREALVSSPHALSAKLEALRARVREERAQHVETSHHDDVSGLSLSDFFDEAPMHSEVVDDALDGSEELVSMEIDASAEGGAEFSFADLGKELSFENLSFDFEDSGSERSEAVDLLDDIWPEDDLSLLEEISSSPQGDAVLSFEDEAFSQEPAPAPPSTTDASDYQGFFDELDDQAHWFSTPSSVDPEEEGQGNAPVEGQESSVAFELVEIDPVERFNLHDVPGISGRSETQDGDAFDVFNSQGQPLHGERPEPSPSSFVPPAHHEPEQTPALSFSFEFDDEEEEQKAPPSPAHVTPSHDEPAPPLTHRQDERAPSLGFGDLSFDSILEEEEPTRARPARQESKLPLPPKIEQPTRQVDVESEEIGSLLTYESQEQPEPVPRASVSVSSDEMSRETRSMPAVDRDLVNPFASSEDAFGGNDWNFDEGPAAMPGLNDDWLEQEPVPEEHIPSHMRDVHNDATAIPGLNSSNSGLPFNPYRHEGERSRHPSSAPHTRSSPGSSSSGGFRQGDRSSPPPQRLPSPPALRQTQENQELYQEDDGGRGRSPSSRGHDYEQLASMLKDTQEKHPSAELKDTQEKQQPAALKDTQEKQQPAALKDTQEKQQPSHSSSSWRQEEEEDPFDMFDLGFQAPRIDEVQVDRHVQQEDVEPPSSPRLPSSSKLPSPPMQVDIEGARAVKSTMYGAPFIAPSQKASLDDMPTPLPPAGSSSAAEDMTEDEFFALAESIAAENSVAFESGAPGLEIEDAPTHQGENGRGRQSTMPVSNSGLKPPPNPFHAKGSTGFNMPSLEQVSSPMIFGEVEEDELSVNMSMEETPSAEELFNKAQIAYDLGRFEDALELAIGLKGGEYDAEARTLIIAVEQGLERSQLERIGPLSRTPVLDVPLAELANLDLDHRAGFLLSQIDGFLTFEDLLDLSAMPRLETIVVLADLLDRAIIKTI